MKHILEGSLVVKYYLKNFETNFLANLLYLMDRAFIFVLYRNVAKQLSQMKTRPSLELINLSLTKHLVEYSFIWII